MGLAAQAQMLSTLAAALILLLIGSTVPTTALGTHVNRLQAEALDAESALALDSSGGVFHGHEKTKSAHALGRRMLQSFQCPDGKVQCPSGIQECFQPGSQACDTFNDCSDGSDEDAYYCANVSTSCRYPLGKCPSNKCSYQRVIEGKLIGTDIFWCDRKTDCLDNSDEDPGFCAGYDCASQGAMRCPGTIPQCMPRISTMADIPSQQYRNRNGGFFGPIPDGVASAICDGVKDCEDGSDEDPARCGPPPPPDNGVCGSGPAKDFPTRCWFNSDPQGRYVCCDSAGCDGFNGPDYLIPRCKSNGYVPEFVTLPKTRVFPKDVPCPFVGGFASNSCFDAAGTYHVCCANPDSCAAFGPNGEPRCTNENYVLYSP